LSLPSAVFALAFILLGWIASHSIAYTLVGFVPHDHHEGHMHGYLNVLKLASGCGLVLAFTLALRSFFRHGSFGEWLHKGGITGTRKQVVLATALPAVVFVLVEHVERIIAGTGTSPPVQLLVVGVLVQWMVGLLCLALVRATFRVAKRIIGYIARGRFVQPTLCTTDLVLTSLILTRRPGPMADSQAGRAPPTQTFLF
jgi:hypothetical protein